MNNSIYYLLGTEVASLMQLQEKLIKTNEALKELKYIDNDITCHICLHHHRTTSYVPIIEVKKDFVYVKVEVEKALLLNQIDEQLTKVKNLNKTAKLNLPIIEEIENILKEVRDE